MNYNANDPKSRRECVAHKPKEEPENSQAQGNIPAGVRLIGGPNCI